MLPRVIFSKKILVFMIHEREKTLIDFLITWNMTVVIHVLSLNKIHRTVFLFCVIVYRIPIFKKASLINSISTFLYYLLNYFLQVFILSPYFLYTVSLILHSIRKINTNFSSLSLGKIHSQAKWILDCLLVCKFYEIWYLFTWYKKLGVEHYDL